MTATITEARDQVFTILKTALDGIAFPLNRVSWDDAPTLSPVGNNSAVYVEMRHTGGAQASLANHGGERKWTNSGTLFITVDTPREEGGNEMDNLLGVIQEAYEGSTTPGSVWFRNARILQDKSVPRNWRRAMVLVDFQYDRIH